jgi:putative Mg2+ transporter-C (MgtC) family protein
MEIFSADSIDIFIKLMIATGLGLLLGIERIMARKSAGLRTYAMVSMTSALFICISQVVSLSYLGTVGFDFDPLRVAAQIVVGIGFLGAGLIIFQDNKVQNLTTASGLWTSAAIGMAVGFGLYAEAVFATFLTLFVMGVISKIEHKLRTTFHW